MSEPDTQTSRAARYWEQQHRTTIECSRENFLSHPMIQSYISVRAFGTNIGHLDALVREIRERTQPGDKICSVGCGPAEKERFLAGCITDREFVGIDIAAQVIAETKEQSVREGLTNLELRVGDFNDLDLEARSYRVILGLGAIHHVRELEVFWDRCTSSLQKDGSILAQEYIGPSRFQWTANQIEAGNLALTEIVPVKHQTHHQEIKRPVIEDMIRADPSEAVRSAEILGTCEAAGMTIERYVGVGCSLLQPVLNNQIHTFDPGNWDHNLVLARLFSMEDRYLGNGTLVDDFAMFIAKPPS